jgi:universal stress protein A
LLEATVLNVRSILCPVDFSEQSRRALLWASAITQFRGAELTVLSVVEPLLAQAAGIRFGVDLTDTAADPPLREFVEATLPDGVREALHVRMEMTVGDPSETILQSSRRLNAGLIVMGTHGLGEFRKILLGSTTEQVLQRTEWPVLAVPAGAVSAPAAEHPGGQLKSILLATDFRESATAAAHWAADLASDIRVRRLVLAHVVEPVLVSPLWQPLVADGDSEHVASAQRALARLGASIPDTHTDCVVSVGRPADTIASLAVEYEAGLVVMGLANPEDQESQKPGSIAYRVLRLAHVAVVVVPRSVAQTALDPPAGRHAFQTPEHVAQSGPEY